MLIIENPQRLWTTAFRKRNAPGDGPSERGWRGQRRRWFVETAPTTCTQGWTQGRGVTHHTLTHRTHNLGGGSGG